MSLDRLPDVFGLGFEWLVFQAGRPWVGRAVSALIALGTGVVLGTAAWLTPSPSGHATHLQLGLGQCSFLQATGRPCPMCGATTTFTLAAHFRWVSALLNQPFAFLLFLLTVGIFGLSLAEVIQPRGRWAKVFAWIEPVEGRLATFFLIMMGLGWMYKITRMGAWG